MSQSKYVLVGGHNDGKTVPYDLSTIEMPIIPKGQRIQKAEDFETVLEFKTELYVRASIATERKGPSFSDMNEVVFYRHKNLSVHEALLKLLEGYK